MASGVATWHKLVARNYKLLKAAWKQAQANINDNLRQLQPQPKPIPVRVPSQLIHPVAHLRQGRRGFHTALKSINTAARNFTTAAGTSARTVKYDKASFPKSRTASAVNAWTGRTPYASTLRPNLTGGALPRTAGGYGLGSGRAGGARYFSHTPAAPAQVIQNVSQAVRAFYIGGNRAQYDGVNLRNGEKRYRAVGSLQDETTRKMKSLPKATPGSYIDFQVNPTITALTPLSSVAGFCASSEPGSPNETLNTDGLLDVLSVDFSRALKDLAAVLSDLQRLSDLGDLPITYRSSGALRVHFPGCDAETVENLCEEIGVKRGVVIQDEDFDDFVGTEIALMFPFASSKTASEMEWKSGRQDATDWQDMIEQRTEKYSTRSQSGCESLFEQIHPALEENNPWLSSCSSPEDYGSLSSPNTWSQSPKSSDPLEYQNFEGIYRFIELCDSAQR